MTRFASAVFSLIVLAASAATCFQKSTPFSESKIRELEVKAATGDVHAQVQLGRAYQIGDGVPQNGALAVKWYRAAAEKNDAEGQNSLGTMYRMGIGVERNRTEAVVWYQRAAQQGYAPALYNLGTAHYNGDGVAIDDVEAYAHFYLAERAGNGAAREAVRRSETEMGTRRLVAGKLLAAQMLAAGIEVPGDGKAALEILRNLNEGGDPELLLKLAEWAREGRGLPRDCAVAYRLCQQAATAGSRNALLCMAEMNENGEGMEPNGVAAAELYLRAIRAGSDQAAIQLAAMYDEGRVVPRDRIKSYLLLKWAAVDNARAKQGLAELKATMSPAELKNAEQAWSTWRP